jgi:hypothetical protein
MLLGILMSKKAYSYSSKHIKIVQNQTLATGAVNVKQFGLLIAGITIQQQFKLLLMQLVRKGEELSTFLRDSTKLLQRI